MGDLLLAAIVDRGRIKPPFADPLAAQLACEAVVVSDRLECSAEPLLSRDVVLGAHSEGVLHGRLPNRQQPRLALSRRVLVATSRPHLAYAAS